MIAAVRPWTVPVGRLPLLVTSDPAGSVMMNCKWLMADEANVDIVNVLATPMLSKEVCARAVVATGVQTPALVQAIAHSLIVT